MICKEKSGFTSVVFGLGVVVEMGEQRELNREVGKDLGLDFISWVIMGRDHKSWLCISFYFHFEY